MKTGFLKEYFRARLWLDPCKKMPFFKRLAVHIARIIVLTGQRFIQNQCMVKAASLTFYTLLSVVPVLALAFGIAKGLGMGEYLKEKLREAASQYPEIAEKLLAFADSTLQNTQGGIIAGVGVLILLWSAVKLMSSIENNLNEIWGIRQGRSLIRKFTDYITILMICPILLLTSGSALVFASTHMTRLLTQIPGGEFFSPVLRFSSTLLPMIIVWIVFSFIYIAIPNTKVNIIPALCGGLISSCAYTFLQSAYIFTQFTTSSLSAVYGSFAALPLFLIWLNLSWIIVLGGAQLVFSIQNVQEYEMLPIDGLLSQRQKYVYSLEILSVLTAQFRAGTDLLSDQEISARLQLPIRCIRELLFELTNCGLLLEAAPRNKHSMMHFYQIAREPDQITVKAVIMALENQGENGSTFRKQDRSFEEILQERYSSKIQTKFNTPVYQLSKDFNKP